MFFWLGEKRPKSKLTHSAHSWKPPHNQTHTLYLSTVSENMVSVILLPPVFEARLLIGCWDGVFVKWWLATRWRMLRGHKAACSSCPLQAAVLATSQHWSSSTRESAHPPVWRPPVHPHRGTSSHTEPPGPLCHPTPCSCPPGGCRWVRLCPVASCPTAWLLVVAGGGGVTTAAIGTTG